MKPPPDTSWIKTEMIGVCAWAVLGWTAFAIATPLAVVLLILVFTI